MITYIIRIYLFDYQGSLDKHKVLKLYWNSTVTPLYLTEKMRYAKNYCLERIQAKECSGYHIICGEN
jgi:hypothetical protein